MLKLVAPASYASYKKKKTTTTTTEQTQTIRVLKREQRKAIASTTMLKSKIHHLIAELTGKISSKRSYIVSEGREKNTREIIGNGANINQRRALI